MVHSWLVYVLALLSFSFSTFYSLHLWRFTGFAEYVFSFFFFISFFCCFLSMSISLCFDVLSLSECHFISIFIYIFTSPLTDFTINRLNFGIYICPAIDPANQRGRPTWP